MEEEEHIKEIVRKTVQRILNSIGWKIDDMDAIREDLVYLRKKRKSAEDIGRLVRRSVISVGIPALLYGAWQALKYTINK